MAAILKKQDMEKENIHVADVEQSQVLQQGHTEEGYPEQESNCGLSIKRNPLAQPTDDNGVPSTKPPSDTSQSRRGTQQKDACHQNADSSEHHPAPKEDEEKTPTPLSRELTIDSLKKTENVSSQAKSFLGVSQEKQAENVPDVNTEDFQEPEHENNGMENNDQSGVHGRQKDDEPVPKEVLVDRASQVLLGENNKSPTKSVGHFEHDLVKETLIKKFPQKELDILEPGDMISVRRFGGIYYHYMIYVGNVKGQDNGDDYGDVVHLTGRVLNLVCCIKPEVKRENLKDVITPRSHVRVERGAWKGRRPLPAEKVIDRACSHMGRKGFNPVSNNCESFARGCKYGQWHSKQAEVCLRFLQQWTCGIFKPLEDQTNHLQHSSQAQKKDRSRWSYENEGYQEISEV